MNRNTIIAAVLAGLGFLAGCGPNVAYEVKPIPVEQALKETVVAFDRGFFISDKIVILDVDGLLLNRRGMGLFGEIDNPTGDFVEKVDKAQADSNVRAVVLRINSPGGSVTATDIMHRRLQEFRKARKVPVVAVLEDVGASGAYYLACAADRILAHPTTVTGSIGVIVQTVSFAGTMQKLGIEAKAITSGPLKDMASPLKPLDAREREILQGLVNDFYGRFLDAVVEGRPKLTREQVRALADGRVFTGEQAKASGLVDDLGYVNDGIALAKTLSNTRRAKVVLYHRPLGYRSNVYSAARVPAAAQFNLLNVNVPSLFLPTQPQFLYLWTSN